MGVETGTGSYSMGATPLTNAAIKARLLSLGMSDSAANIAKVRSGKLNLDDLEAAKTLIRVPEIEAAKDLVNLGAKPFEVTQFTQEEAKAAQDLVDMSAAAATADADIELAIDDLAKITGGAKISSRVTGGSETKQALVALKTKLFEATGETATKLDELGADIVKKLPETTKNFGKVAILVFIAKNPWLFSQLAHILRDNWVYLIPEGPGYDILIDIAKETLRTLGVFAVNDQIAYVKASPVYGLIVSAALVRMVAKAKDQTPMQYLAEKTKYALSVVGMVYTGGKEIVDGFIAYMETPEAKKSLALQSLRNQIKDLKRRDGVIYEGLGPAEIEGLMKQTPSPAETTALAAQRLVSRLLAKARTAEATAPKAPDVLMGNQGGRRRRKTKKRAIKKRKMTRRALTFSY